MRFSLAKLPALAAIVFALQSTTATTFAAEEFSSGDQFVVAQEGAPLMRGWQTLATLAQGQRLNVLQTEGDWIGTSIVVNGRAVGGWLHKRQLATPAQYAQRRTTRRAYSYQPAQPTGGYPSTNRGYSPSPQNRRLIMGATPYGPSYWRADRKVTGY